MNTATKPADILGDVCETLGPEAKKVLARIRALPCAQCHSKAEAALVVGMDCAFTMMLAGKASKMPDSILMLGILLLHLQLTEFMEAKRDE